MPAVRQSTVNFSARQLQHEAGLSESTSVWTVYRELRNAGYSFARLKKKGVLGNQDLRDRLLWAKVNASKPVAYWANLAVYIDCVSFVFKAHPCDTARTSGARAWLRRSERLRVTAKGRFKVPPHRGCGRRVFFAVNFSLRL